MLSILIPTYNFDVRLLVQKLHQQGLKLNIPFEIIIVDDASTTEFVQLNQALQNVEHLSYSVLENNIGRSKIRNYLATQAQYDYLLFMDCDSMPVNDDYLKNYVQHLAPYQLLYGGRCYQSSPPTNQQFLFHWYYGKHREESTAINRQKKAHQSFMTNNFLIPKSIFNQIKFDEKITQYGHEDTLFGLELKQRNIPILHLDNPLEHIGLETATTFLRKSEQALQNLHQLNLQYDVKDDVKLLRYHAFLKKYRLIFVVRSLFFIFKTMIIKNIYSSSPKLLLFDIYKLGYFVEWKKK